MKEREVDITVDPYILKGNLSIPENAKGIVLFVHGSGSSRFSPRNQFVAKKLQEANLVTLLMDLLIEEEEEIDERTKEYRFDIDFLAERLIGTTTWLKAQNELKDMSIGYFGASTGAAAALVAAAELGKEINAIVSRGGRPDLADSVLDEVTAATLLIIGSIDYGVIELNEMAYSRLECTKKMEIVEGATHLFEENGKLEVVSDLAAKWFVKYL